MAQWRTEVNNRLSGQAFGIALVLWCVSMPICLFEYSSRGVSFTFRVWNLYNHLFAVIHEPIRVFTELSAFMAIIVYSIPSFLHIGACLGLGALLHGMLRSLARSPTRDKSSVQPKPPMITQSVDDK